MDKIDYSSIKNKSAISLKAVFFDVFDTVLTRSVGSPETVFLLLGTNLAKQELIPCTPETFCQFRIEAEKLGHQHTGAMCSIENIYTELAQLLHLNFDQRRDIMLREMDLEANLIQTVPDAAALIQQARNRGLHIIFISDMYMPSEWLKNILIRRGLLQDGDRCYVSCEFGKTKESGELFSEVLKQEGIKPDEVMHMGNRYDKDVQPAKRLGLGTKLYDVANLNRFEAILESFSQETGGLASAMAGASRMARLNIPIIDTKQVAIRDIAAGVAAPMLMGYVLWILQRAKQLELDCLYFVSRDGQILLEIAKRLAPHLDFPCELRYLYGSRQAWNLPAIFEGSSEELAWIWDSTDFISIESLLRRVCLQPEQLEDALIKVGLSRQDWHRNLQHKDLITLKQLLLSDHVKPLILEQSRQKREVLIHYLEQENILKQRHWGLVDLGWYGSLQNSLSAILLKGGGALPVGFYFGLLKGDIPQQQGSYREAYFIDEQQHAGFVETKFETIIMMEMFCASNHGTVINYVEKEGWVTPVLKEQYNQKVIDWGLNLVNKTIILFTNSIIANTDWINLEADIREASAELLKAFWKHPSIDEVKGWADFPWEDGLGSATYYSPLAKSYHYSDILRMIYKRKILYHHRSAWHEGSLLLSSRPARAAITYLGHVFRFIRSTEYRVRKRLGNFSRS